MASAEHTNSDTPISGDNSLEQRDHHYATLDVDDSQYKAQHLSQVVGTQTGDDGMTAETRLTSQLADEDSRPNTAVSSQIYDPEAEAFLAKYTTSGVVSTDEANSTAASGSFLARLALFPDPNDQPGFVYGQPPTLQLDFTRKTKGRSPRSSPPPPSTDASAKEVPTQQDELIILQQGMPVDTTEQNVPQPDLDEDQDLPSVQLFNEMQSQPQDEHSTIHVEPSQQSWHLHKPLQHGLEFREQYNEAQHRPEASVAERRKSNGKRKRSAAPVPEPASESSSDLGDYLTMAALKHTREYRKKDAQIEIEREHFRDEIQRISEEKQNLEEQLHITHELKSNRDAEIKGHKQKFRTFDSKVNGLKKYVEGLSNDFGKLKQSSNEMRQNIEAFEHEVDEREARQARLHRYMSECTDKSASIKNEVLKVAREAESDLREVHVRVHYLEKQLSERVGMLAEERDRRSQLERQLASASTSTSISAESLQRMVRANHNATLDKLYEIHATLEESEDKKVMIERVEQALAALQGVDSQQAANSDELVSIKTLMDSLSDSMVNLLEASQESSEAGPSSSAAILEFVENGLKDLKTNVGQHELVVQQNATYRETISGLNEQIKACNVRVTHFQSQLEDIRARETQLKDQNISLQTKITTLQNEIPPENNAADELCEVQARLGLTISTLETKKSELEQSAESLRTIGIANTNLQTQVNALQGRIQELESRPGDFGPQREELEQKYAEELAKVRADVELHETQFRAQRLAAKDNDIKRLSTQKDNLQKRLKPLTDELNATKAKLEGIQQQQTGLTAKDREVQELKQLATSQKSEIESLQATVTDFQNAVKGSKGAKDQNDTLLSQVATEKKKLREKINEHAAIVKQVQDLTRNLDQAHTEKKAVESALENDRSEHEAGLERLRESCRQTVRNQEVKVKKQVEALQQRLTETQDELQAKVEAEDKFRADVETSWETEQREYQEEAVRIMREAAEAGAQKDGALLESERLRSELVDSTKEQVHVLQQDLEQQKQRALAAEQQVEELRKRPQQPPSNVSNGSNSRLPVPNPINGITPPSTKENEPPRPKKRVDRSSGNIIDSAPVPAPEALRLDCRTRPSSYASVLEESQTVTFHGPVVEESQQTAVHGPVVEKSQHRDVLQPIQVEATVKKQHLPFLLSDDAMLDTTSIAAEVVEQTQSEDDFPLFAAVDAGIAASRAPRSMGGSSVFSVPSARDLTDGEHFRDQPYQPTAARERLPACEPTRVSSTEFSIYDDSQGSTKPTQHAGAAHYPLVSSKEDKYTFHKQFPQPNTASRLVSLNDQPPPGLKRRGSVSGSAPLSAADRHRTPEVRSPTRVTPPSRILDQARGASNLSSSPDFINAAHQRSARRSNYQTYAGHGTGSAKRRKSGTNPTVAAIVDPRLVGRKAPIAARATPNRNARESQAVEGYEQERRKRLSHDNSDSAHRGSDINPEKYSLRGNPITSSSVNDLPNLPRLPSTSSGGVSHYGSSNSTRMRTLAGAATKSSVRPRKMNKQDEFGAKFSRELVRR